MIKIIELKKELLDDFFTYLSRYISENGSSGSTLFAPLNIQQSILSSELKTKFIVGLDNDFGHIGWRSTWLALNQLDMIVGHIDIRSNNYLNSEHRVILGMGVDRNFRSLGIGKKLLEFIVEYCKKSNKINWIDLEVMTNNIPAIKLYNKIGFKQVYEKQDMFRINNISYNFTFMTLKI